MAGRLYIDASDWGEWHYIDFAEMSALTEADSTADLSGLWQTVPVAAADSEADESRPVDGTPGVYTYWYDVFGAGLDNREFRFFAPADVQPEPEAWTIALHRNNVRTNGGAVCATGYTSIADLPEGTEWLTDSVFVADTWNETAVWTDQSRMLSGLIGNQGIAVNEVLGRWLTIETPPMPPAFVHDAHVFVLRLADGTYGALRLADYMDNTGKKCCMTIEYKYPL